MIAGCGDLHARDLRAQGDQLAGERLQTAIHGSFVVAWGFEPYEALDEVERPILVRAAVV